jgi:hypothetical protein
MNETPEWDKPLDALELGRLHGIVINRDEPRERRYVAAERIYRSHKIIEADRDALREAAREYLDATVEGNATLGQQAKLAKALGIIE